MFNELLFTLNMLKENKSSMKKTSLRRLYFPEPDWGENP